MNLPAVLCVLFASTVCASKLQEVFRWKEVTFAWPSEQERLAAIDSGHYIPKNNLPLGLEVYKNKLFITVPRWKAGVAASLTYVDLNSNDKSPTLIPYPSWQANRLPGSGGLSERIGGRDELNATVVSKELQDNSTIISTFRLKVDKCDRLWVMDTGLSDILGHPEQYAPPAIVIFDLKTDTLIRRYTLKHTDLKENSFFANIVLDVSRVDCEKAYAYIPDLGAYGVVVYSYADNDSWRVKHNFFHFDPLNGNYNVGGVNFQWTDGVFALAVGPEKTDGTKTVFFHAFSSTKEFAVCNKILQNKTHVTTPAAYYDFILVGDRGPNSQSSAEVYDAENNVIFYTQVNKDAIGCWNVFKPYNTDTQGLVDSDSDALVFPNDITVQDGHLYVLSDRLPVFIYRELDPNQYNYRILKGRTVDIISGTPCERRRY